MTQKERAAKGLLYDANFDPGLLRERDAAKQLIYQYNQLPPTYYEARRTLIRQMVKEIGEDFVIESPFFLDYGYNITIGSHFYANYYCTILDGAKVTIGDYVFLAPGVTITTAGHPLDPPQRNQGLEYAYPIAIGNNVWIGANVAILPGVTIGNDVTIGAGSVVNRDIPSGVVAAGNPCKVIRKITPEDVHKYDVPPAHLFP